MKAVCLACLALLWVVPAQAKKPAGGYTLTVPQRCARLPLLRDKQGNISFFHPKELRARAVRMVKPDYPPIEQNAQTQGSVLIGVVVGTTGAVQCAWLVEGHPFLGPQALQAARKWKFQPMMTASGKISYGGLLKFNFSWTDGFQY
jgi:TonB family protein